MQIRIITTKTPKKSTYTSPVFFSLADRSSAEPCIHSQSQPGIPHDVQRRWCPLSPNLRRNGWDREHDPLGVYFWCHKDEWTNAKQNIQLTLTWKAQVPPVANDKPQLTEFQLDPGSCSVCLAWREIEEAKAWGLLGKSLLLQGLRLPQKTQVGLEW